MHTSSSEGRKLKIVTILKFSVLCVNAVFYTLGSCKKFKIAKLTISVISGAVLLSCRDKNHLVGLNSILLNPSGVWRYRSLMEV